MRNLTLFALLLAGCGDDGGPKPDDAGVPPIDSSIDAAEAMCPTDTSCPCFSNYDCPDGTKCTSQDNTGTNVYCVPGQRGTGALGRPCTGEADCASALCVEIDAGGMQCSDVCDTEANCVTDLPTCLFIATEGVSICTP